MTGLFSCFRSNKNKRHSRQRQRRLSGETIKENVQVYYIEPQTQPYANLIINEHNDRNESVKAPSYYASSPECIQGISKQSRSYPVSPERNSLRRVYSFDQSLLLERQKAPGSQSQTVYAAEEIHNSPLINENETLKSSEPFPYEIPPDPVPRRSRLSYGVAYEENILNSSPKCDTETNNEVYEPSTSKGTSNYMVPTLERDDINILEDETHGSLLRYQQVDNGNFISNNSKIVSDEFVYSNQNGIQADHVINTSVRTRPHNQRKFSKDKVEPMMIYQTQPKGNSPMKARSPVHVIPLKESKHTQVLTTPDGHILRPMGSKVKRLSLKSEQGGKLSIIRPMQQAEAFPLTGAENPVIIAAPMLGGNKRAPSRTKRPKSILRKGGNKSYGRQNDDYGVDDDPFNENEYTSPPAMAGRYGGSSRYDMEAYDKYGPNRRGPDRYGPNRYGHDSYGADPYGADLYSADPYGGDPYGGDMYGDNMYGGDYYFPAGERYRGTQPRGQSRGYGYDDDVYEEQMEDYGRGIRPKPQMRARGPRYQQAIYAAQMPDVTLPDASPAKGKNPPFKKVGKSVGKETEISEGKDVNSPNCERQEETENHPVTGSKLKLCSSHPIDPSNDMDFICFSPDKFLKNSTGQTEPGSKLRWRIIIKRGDEE